MLTLEEQGVRMRPACGAGWLLAGLTASGVNHLAAEVR